MCLGEAAGLAQRFRTQRSLTAGMPNSVEYDRAFWADIFYDMDLSKQISIELEGDGDHKRTLNISYRNTGVFEPYAQGNQILSVSPIVFEYKRPGLHAQQVRVAPVGNTYMPIGGDGVVAQAFYASVAGGLFMPETVDNFSKLVIAKEQADLVMEMQTEFQFIKGVDVAAPFGLPAIYVDVDGLTNKLQLGLVSGGVAKIMALLAAVASKPNGVVLIDEIENGVFHDRYEALWKSLHRFAKARSVQIFAVTHSDECLEALASASSEGWAGEVSFIRSVSDGPKKSFEQFSADSIFGAMRLGDVR
jgi:hypothetical protein